MKVFDKYLMEIDNPEHHDRMKEILNWVKDEFPHLKPIFKWNTPMFSDHGTFIIGFSIAKHHLSVSPEVYTMTHFAESIAEAGYSATKGLFRIPWNKEVNYELLKNIINFNIEDKAEHTNFWR